MKNNIIEDPVRPPHAACGGSAGPGPARLPAFNRGIDMNFIIIIYSVN